MYIPTTFMSLNSVEASLLIVAGGGSGGNPGSGAGAGGFISGSFNVSEGLNVFVSVGEGGTFTPVIPGSTTLTANNGQNSFIILSEITLTAIGGGRGGAGGRPAGNGGSGGGTASQAGDFVIHPGAGTPGQGNRGGFAQESSGGGGGGASDVGGNGSNRIGIGNCFGGSGGAGKQWIDGKYYAGGGGARSGCSTPAIHGAGGIGGGGNGGIFGHGAPNTGGGGGGGSGNASGGLGGSGIVSFAYPNIFKIVSGSSLISETSASGDFTFTSFLSGSGNIQFIF
jgi:hypothetical protein